MTNMKKYIQTKYILPFLLIACAGCQLLITCYFNFLKAPEHMTIDSSWEYLKAMVIGDNGGFFPTDLLHATTQPLVERIFLLVAPLYRLTGNVYTAYAIANLVITLLSVFVIYKIGQNLDFEIWHIFVIVNLFLCPYLASGFNINNDLGYFICVNGFMAAQNMSELFFLLILYIFTIENIEKKSIVVSGITIVFGAYLSVCKGLGMLTWVGIPLIAYVIVYAWIKNEPKVLVSWKAVIAYLTIIGMFVGRAIGGAMGLSYQDGGYNWTDASNIFSNIGKMIEGFMLLIGAVPATGIERGAFSINGLPYVFGRVIFYVIVIAIAWNVVKLIKERDFDGKQYQVRLMLVVLFAVTFLQYSIVDTRLGGEGDIFCARYLITALIGALFLVGFFLKELGDSFFKRCGVSALFASIIFMDLFSDYYLSCADNSQFRTKEILAVVEEYNPGLIVFWSDFEELTPAEKIIRVEDYSRVHKNVTRGDMYSNFGDYSYYDDTTEYAGATMIVTATENPGAPAELLEKYQLVYEENDISIYYADQNYIDLAEWCSNL